MTKSHPGQMSAHCLCCASAALTHPPASSERPPPAAHPSNAARTRSVRCRRRNAPGAFSPRRPVFGLRRARAAPFRLLGPPCLAPAKRERLLRRVYLRPMLLPALRPVTRMGSHVLFPLVDEVDACRMAGARAAWPKTHFGCGRGRVRFCGCASVRGDRGNIAAGGGCGAHAAVSRPNALIPALGPHSHTRDRSSYPRLQNQPYPRRTLLS